MAGPKRLEMTALLGLILQLAFTVFCWLLSEASHSEAVQAEAWHLAVGVPVWLLVLVHGRQRRLAREEREERERLKDARLSDEIFAETELDTARASAGLHVFETAHRIVVALSAALIPVVVPCFASIETVKAVPNWAVFSTD